MEYLLNIFQAVSFEKIIFHLLGYICHQDKSILFRFEEVLIPLCPRCLGLHSGFFLTSVIIKFFIQRPISINKLPNLSILILLISLTAIHWLLGFFNIMKLNSADRLFTGLVSGSGLCVFLNSLKYKYNRSVPDIPAKEERIFVSLLLASVSLGFLGNYRLIFLSIFLIVISNITSITRLIWQVIEHNKNFNYLNPLKKEM